MILPPPYVMRGVRDDFASNSELISQVHPGRWCWLRLLLKPKVAGSSPVRDANPGSSRSERRKNTAIACSPAWSFLR